VKRGYWGEMRRPGFEVVAQGDRVEVRYWTMAAAQNPDSEVNDWLAKYKQVLEDRLPAADHAIQFSGRGYATPCILVSSRN
jgi:hypothetical protein